MKREYNYDLRDSESVSIVNNIVEKMDNVNVATNSLSKPLSEAQTKEQTIVNPFKASETVVKELKQLLDKIECISNTFHSSLAIIANHRTNQISAVILNNALFDFKPFYHYSNPMNSDIDSYCYCNSCAQSFMERILSTPATEACCERFFRTTSQQTRSWMS